MMFRSNLAIAVSALAISLVPMAPLSALAEAPPDFSRSGLYVAVYGGAAIDTGLLQDLVDVSGAVGFRLGFRGSPHVATEIDMEYAFGFGDSLSGGSLFEQKEFTMTTNIRAYLLTGRIQPYVTFGAGFMHYSASLALSSLDPSLPDLEGDALGFAINAGGGLEMYVTEKIFVDAGAAYIIPFGDVDGFDHVSVRGAIGYKF